MKKILFILLFFISSIVNATIYYVATDGNNGAAGTIGAPWATFQYAVNTVVAGDTVYFRGGTYALDDKVTIDPGNGDGALGNITCYSGYQNETVIFDYSTYTADEHTPVGQVGNWAFGILINNGAGFISFNKFTITNVEQKNDLTEVNGITSAGGHNLTFKQIVVHDVGGRGFFHETPWGFPIEPACGYDTTRYINCDAYNCADSLPYTQSARLGNQADGMKSYGNRGSVIYYIGCRVWNASDDGWDAGSGTIMHYENCWSFRNGLILEGDGDGFKIGSHNDATLDSENPIIRFVTNCIAAENDLGGFRLLEYWDYYRQKALIYNNFAYENGFSVDQNNPDPGHEAEDRGNVRGVWRNNISYRTDAAAQFASTYEPYINEHHNSWDWSEGGYPGWVATDTVTITEADFISLDISQLSGPRQSDGRLPEISFGRLSGDSDLLGAGYNIGMSDDPDIGVDWAYYDITYGAGEEEPDPEIDYPPTIYSNNSTLIKSTNVFTGGNVTSDGGATITERGVVWGTSVNPTTSNNKVVMSGTTGNYSTTLWGLSSNTTYHVRSYATNSVGTSYGADVEFTTDKYTVAKSGSKVFVKNGKILIVK